MEDYSGASSARYLDVEALLSFKPSRLTAAVHMGGVAVECQIKAQILRYHGIDSWSEDGKRTRDAYYGRTLDRPGHHLLSAVKLMTRIYEKAKSDPLFIKHLDKLMHPVGSRDADFIDLRYVANDISNDTLEDWRKSLKYVNSWLIKNEMAL